MSDRTRDPERVFAAACGTEYVGDATWSSDIGIDADRRHRGPYTAGGGFGARRACAIDQGIGRAASPHLALRGARSRTRFQCAGRDRRLLRLLLRRKCAQLDLAHRPRRDRLSARILRAARRDHFLQRGTRRSDRSGIHCRPATARRSGGALHQGRFRTPKRCPRAGPARHTRTGRLPSPATR